MDHLTPQQTFDFLAADPTAVFVDCRSEMEFYFVGHPVGAIAWPPGPSLERKPMSRTRSQLFCLAAFAQVIEPLILRREAHGDF